MGPQRQEMFARAVETMAALMTRRSRTKPVLYASNGLPIRPTVPYQYQKRAAKREGSMKQWIPVRHFNAQSEALERERIAERATDLVYSDPHAAGIVETFASTVVGSGLVPHPIVDADAIGLDKDKARVIQNQERAVWHEWCPTADAGGRLSFYGQQFLLERNLVQYGEYFVLLHMLDDPGRPYSLACQVVHPLRVKTPSDLAGNPNIRDGIELGRYGEPVAYWIKRAEAPFAADLSSNFVRVPARTGHRWNVLHTMIIQDAEQVRGISQFSAGMKYLRDLNDFLDAELVANVVTAAFALFIQVESGDPYGTAAALAGLEESGTAPDGSPRTDRYQEIIPGSIMYGNPGEEPKPIAASRPGQTFEPFVKVIKKAIAASLNLPYVVAFSDVSETNYAGFRAAMLDAWRVFMCRRAWLGATCQKIFTMLQEEAWLRGRLDVDDFYGRMSALTRCDWRGGPKGDIEPIKEIQADILAIQNNLKTRSEAVAERGGDFRSVIERLEEEQELLRERGLPLGAARQDVGTGKEDTDNADAEEG